jgi:subtilisin family serine protease
MTSHDDTPERARAEGGGPDWDGPEREDWQVVTAGAEGVAFIADEVIVHGDAALRRLQEVVRDARSPRRADDGWALVGGVADPAATTELLRAEGHVVGPNHVLPAHACGSTPCGPHPAVAWRLAEGGLDADPFRTNPFRTNPFRTNPFRTNPFRTNPFRTNAGRTQEPQNSAIPAAGPGHPARPLSGGGTYPEIVVLDTGVATGAQRPDLLSKALIEGGEDHPDVPLHADGQLLPADGYLDPVAGHGTFIAGVIEQLAPGCTIRLPRVVSPFGLAEEFEVAQAIRRAVDGKYGVKPKIISLSLGGPVLESPDMLRAAVAYANLREVVLVASAGNDGTCVPHYPAALPGVVAVGAAGPDGPEPWTNYGPWVDACAPGADLVSSFFQDFDGSFPTQNTVDVDAFRGWARWSGTSFAAPVVVAALAREMVHGRCSAPIAVERVVRAHHLARLPCLGTVVNL